MAPDHSHSVYKYATRSAFSWSVSWCPSTRLKNSTVSSSVSSRPSCRYGGTLLDAAQRERLDRAVASPPCGR